MPEPRAQVPDSGGVFAGYNGTGSTIAKHRLVKASSSGVDYVTPATDGSAHILGATMAAIADGFAGDVQRLGVAKVEASAAIAIGALVTAAAGGKGVTASTTNQVFGVANTAAAADGDIIEVRITRGAAP